MAKQIVNVGTAANSGGGDPLRTAFTKINENFTELYGKVVILEGGGVAIKRDAQGSIFGDDSTLLVDAVNGKIVGPIESTSILPGNGLTDIGSTGNRFYNAWFTGQVETDSVLANIFYGPLTGNVTGDVNGNITGTLDGDLTGSVFGDDSGLLVDAVNNKIVGVVDTTSLTVSSTNVAIGLSAGETNQGASAVAVGDEAGKTNQEARAVAIGDNAGATTQGSQTVAIGNRAGAVDQSAKSVAIGSFPGQTNQGGQAVAIGTSAGNLNQGEEAVAIGEFAGMQNQGESAVAIGASAGISSQAANSIVINASGTTLDNTQASSFVVKPIRSATMTTILGYNAATGEVTHNAAIPGYISLADLKTEVAASADFAAFKVRIAAL